MFFISEVSSNHHRDVKRCLEFVRESKRIGCDAVKFQLFKIKELFAPEILAKREEIRKRDEWELPVSFLPEIAAYCRELKIQFSCTPFYLKAVEELYPHVDFYKVASYELLWDELLTECAQTGKPVVLSTGMAVMPEIAHAVSVLKKAGCKDLTLLHCVSNYPTLPKDCNLAAIKTLRDAFGCKVGWSDHTVQPAVLSRAIHRWNAEAIEFHLDLDGKGEEFQAGHCWLPDQMGAVIAGVKMGLVADGSGEKVTAECERVERDWRADPSDGLRPLLKVREEFRKS